MTSEAVSGLYNACLLRSHSSGLDPKIRKDAYHDSRSVRELGYAGLSG